MRASVKKIRLFIGGMTCVNCQNRIEKSLKKSHGVVSVRVSYSGGTADIVYDEKVLSLEEITALIEKLDYTVSVGKQQTAPGTGKRMGILVIIIALYILLQSTGVLNLLVPGQLADTKMGYGMLFAVGLVTSVHCIAMCGGINLSQCLPKSAPKKDRDDVGLAFLHPALTYNMGRVLSYTAVGFLLGMIGFLLGGGAGGGVPIEVQGGLKLIAGLYMVIMGVNMLGIFPALRRLTIPMPRALVRRIGKERAKCSGPFLVGVLNGFMPCGPLQAMWLVALAAENPITGALSMLAFSLGTVPLMLGLGSLVSALGKKFTHKVMNAGAVLIAVLGLAMISQGGALNGWQPTFLLFPAVAAETEAASAEKETAGTQTELTAAGDEADGAGTESAVADTEDGASSDVQVINSTLSGGRYPNITVRAGIPVRWVIDAPEGSINGCNYKIYIREYDIEYTFHTGENVIEFTPKNTGVVPYSCWMGMLYGSITVTEEAAESASVPENEAGASTEGIPSQSAEPFSYPSVGGSCCGF